MKPNLKVVCPFCPLHCDDVSVDADGKTDVDCDIARRSFAAALNAASPRIGDSIASAAEVTKHVRGLVEGTIPTVITSSVTLAAAKNLDQFHGQGEIDWVIQQSAARAAMQRTISRDGMIGATLADVRMHADFIWIIGNRDQKILPRINELTLPAGNQIAQIWSPLGVTAAQLGDLLDAIGRQEHPQDKSLAGIYEAALHAKYFAVIWVDDGFDPVEADAASALLLELIAVLNDPSRRESRRAVFVTFDEGQTGRSVSLWRRNEVPGNAGHLFSDDRSVVIRFGEPVESAEPVSIQVGGRDAGIEFANVFVPTAVEGIHRADMMIRGDGAVTLPLQPFAMSDLPTSCEWLSEWFKS